MLRYMVLHQKKVLDDTRRPRIFRDHAVHGFDEWKLFIEVGTEEEAKNFARKIGAAKLTRHWPPEYDVQHPRFPFVPCDRCGCTGTYVWGAIVNGIPQHTGPCFRCEGKGYQNDADQRRNWGYDVHQKVI